MALVCCAGAVSAAAQGGSAPPAAGGQPGRSAQAVAVKRMSGARTAEPPTIDGVLDDRAWDAATAVSDFVQAEPTEGSPATERTDVRLLFDDNALYIGVMCYDSEPSQIVTTDSRRDSSLNDMDSFQIIFDTYLDRQNGFIFGTNALGMWGADAKWGASESLTFSGFAAKTETPGLSDHDYAYNGGTEFRNRVARSIRIWSIFFTDACRSQVHGFTQTMNL